MIARHRLVTVAMVVEIVLLSLLFLHARSITPRNVRISDIRGDDAGSPVRVLGHVHRVDTTAEGNAALVLLDYEDFATLRVIARPWAIADPAQVAPGALVSVVGSVFGSGSAIQVFSEDFGAVTLVAPPSSNLLSIEFVARNAVRLEGQRVVVAGLVADLRTLVDSRHALLRRGPDTMWAFDASGWTAGPATLTGRAYLTSRGRCELFVGSEAEAVETRLDSVAACPEGLLGLPVLLRNVTVEPGELFGTSVTLKDLGDGADYRLAAFVPGWDGRTNATWMGVGRSVIFEGRVEYQATEARWRILADVPPRP